jgi:hypothetical protein
MIDGAAVTEEVSVRKYVSDSLAGLPYPPRQLGTQIAVAVLERPPFQLTAKVEPSPAVPGLPARLVVSATRAPGFTDDIVLGPVAGLPPNIKPPALPPLKKDQAEVQAPLVLDAKLPPGTFAVTVTGKGKYNGKDVTAPSRPATLTLAPPFVLKVEPAPVKLTPGGKVKLKVTAMRQGGFDGPVALEVRNLPAKVTAAKAEVAKGQATAEVELTAAADAPAATRADVNVLGTAAALGNRQNASANFAVAVGKK